MTNIRALLQWSNRSLTGDSASGRLIKYILIFEPTCRLNFGFRLYLNVV